MKIRNPLHLEIIPSPGTVQKQWGDIASRIETVLPFTESVHIDVSDGTFTPNATWIDPAPFAQYTKQATFEVHLMTDNPIQHVQAFADAGFVRFIGQIEKMPDVAAFVAEGQLYGEVGLAIDGPTELKGLALPLDDVDVVLLYTGEKAGNSGAVLLPERLEKVKALRAQDAFISIEIDGGVNDTNIVLAKNAGVTRFVSTGFIYRGNPEGQYEKLRKIL